MLVFQFSVGRCELEAAFHHFPVISFMPILDSVAWNAVLRRIVKLSQVKWEKMSRMISYVSYDYGRKQQIVTKLPALDKLN